MHKHYAENIFKYVGTYVHNKFRFFYVWYRD